MRLNSRLFKLLFLFIFLSCIPIQLIQSSANVGTLYSYIENDPCYDGYLESTIWDTTRAIDITLYNLEDQGESIEITLLSVYNTVNGSLSFGLIVPDTTLSDDDLIALIFRTNTNADFVVNNGEWTFTCENDMKGAFLQYNESVDGVTYEDELDGTDDELAGGFENTYGKGKWDGLQYVFEMHTFLNITDPLGADYRLGENSQIEFFVMFQDSHSGILYTQIREADGDYDYCVLNIGELATTTPSTVPTTLFVLGSVFASFAVITYLSRKRNKRISWLK